ncbi:amidohydrolase [Rhodococcus sp. KBS0724]|jgi:predicted TIM-barrel fold metal-dependent hydrolase|uniref:amidohydrolase family protein n=1 Tax=Rhodococcus sp. KBS0724 TaxID=1179674 RepID=UPI00110DB5D8|nr:amidohydrolase family protein [Rhodococcus sp. KBS0724]TSD47056.1 amidohydrolase [Rhodococcus sp. KBS0724]
MSVSYDQPAGRESLAAPTVGSGIVDVDIHPVPKPGVLRPYLSERWRRHIDEYGVRTTNGLADLGEYPQLYGGAARADAWPEFGSPGSDLDMIRRQLLDKHDVELGVLQCLTPGGAALNPAGQALNPELAAALTRAINDWQLEHLVYEEPRLRASIPVAFEAPDLAVDEINRIGDNPGVVSILGLSKTLEPMGNRKYWPIYAAAVEHGLPLQIHLSQGGGHANTGTGWTSYHTEYHVGHTQSFQSQLLSVIVSGIFDRYPDLRIVFVEGNVAHFVPLLRRLDYHYETLRSEVPHLTRKPSEYVRDHVWLSTQPIDEPPNSAHLVEMIEEFGIDNILYASDYPHFDFDDPDTAFPRIFPPHLRDKVMRENGKRLFRIED